jgi:hypothetical protein
MCVTVIERGTGTSVRLIVKKINFFDFYLHKIILAGV